MPVFQRWRIFNANCIEAPQRRDFIRRAKRTCAVSDAFACFLSRGEKSFRSNALGASVQWLSTGLSTRSVNGRSMNACCYVFCIKWPAPGRRSGRVVDEYRWSAVFAAFLGVREISFRANGVGAFIQYLSTGLSTRSVGIRHTCGSDVASALHLLCILSQRRRVGRHSIAAGGATN